MAEGETAKDEDWKKVEDVLGAPVFDSFPEDTLRMRRNLLVISFIALAYKLNDLTISSDSSLLGVKFDGLTNDVVDQTFFWLTLYLFVHFTWNSIIYLQVWRIRVTGTVLAHRTAAMWASEDGDYPDDPRQSSLYAWWSEKAKQIGNIGKQADELQQKANSWEEKIGRLPESINKKNIVSHVSKSLPDINRHLASLSSRVEAVDKALSSSRIPVSLHRFDRWFSLFQWNQIFKWALIEWGAPILLGGWALIEIFPYAGMY